MKETETDGIYLDNINTDKMSVEEIRLALLVGINDVEAGNVRNATKAFKEFRKSHSIYK